MRLRLLTFGRRALCADRLIIWEVESPMGVANGETRPLLERMNRELFRCEKVHFYWVPMLASRNSAGTANWASPEDIMHKAWTAAALALMLSLVDASAPAQIAPQQ